MEFKNCILNKMWCLFLILSIAKVCQGQLTCYVCDDCDKITADTPQFECNEDFFNTGGATSSSVQTTTEMSKTTEGVTTDNDTSTREETTFNHPTITTEKTTMTTTTKQKTSEPTTTVTTEMVTEPTTETTTSEVTETTTYRTTTATEKLPPSPPTVGPPRNTTAIPTPPNPGTVKTLDDVETLNNQSLAHEQHVNKDEVEIVTIEPTTLKAYKPSAEFRVRQVRSVSNVTFHCYKIQAKTVNGTEVVNRGCSRIQTMESVCGQWKAQHPNETMNKCYPCSRSQCNGSSALNVSISALILAVVAVFMHRK